MKLKQLLCYLSIILLITGISSSTYAAFEIDEYYYPDTQTGYFDVTNNAGDDVYAFAVANSTLFDDMGSMNPIGFAGENDAWAYAVVTKAQWDAGFDFRGDFWEAITPSSPEQPGQTGWSDGSPLWAALPNTMESFEIYFGTEIDTAIIYYTSLNADGYLFNNPLQDGESNRFYFSAGEAGSPYVAFGRNGNPLDSGLTVDHVVPIPSAVFLLGAGLISLVGLRRKQD